MGNFAAPLWLRAIAWPIGGVYRRAERVGSVWQTLTEAVESCTTHILVAVEHSAADATILSHTQALAKLMGSRVTLVHVADGCGGAQLRRARPPRVRRDEGRSRVSQISWCRTFRPDGIPVDCTLAKGESCHRDRPASPKMPASI
jgi:hypothetical protein